MVRSNVNRARPTKPVKIHGGKDGLAARIVELMPPRCANPNKPAPGDDGWLHFVEPYAGGLSVLLALDPEGISEVIGDTNVDLMAFWQVMRDRRLFKDFSRAAQGTNFNEALFLSPNAVPSGLRVEVHRAWCFFVRSRMSLAGRQDAFTGITRNRTRRGMNAEVSAWLTAVEGLPEVHTRMLRVLMRVGPALRLIRTEDGPRTLFYFDPPYLHSTRATVTEYGDHEMTPKQHEQLLTRLEKIKGRFLLSGYRSDLYDTFAKRNGWNRTEFTLANSAAGGKTKRRMCECVWRNYLTA